MHSKRHEAAEAESAPAKETVAETCAGAAADGADPAEQLRAARQAAAEHHDAWLRARAEADNMRKRAQADVAAAHKYALEKFSAELLAVKDSLEAASQVDNATVESMRDGVELTLKQLAAVFGKFGIEEIDPSGDKFDPNRHQAMTLVDSDQEANTVVSVMQKGYALNDRILRPALVMVAKGKPA